MTRGKLANQDAMLRLPRDKKSRRKTTARRLTTEGRGDIFHVRADTYAANLFLMTRLVLSVGARGN
ncbi:hypothetical protein J6590_001271 [Homalodisca vitripennis]|nr:hypothetical protein J6590_001271 [Homalodisca vitripennis]